MSHLRAGLHDLTRHVSSGVDNEYLDHKVASLGVVAVSPGPAVAITMSPAQIMFEKMDTNKDGKVDQYEFVNAQQAGVLPLAAAPAPAQTFAIAAGPSAGLPVPAPAPAPAPSPEEAEVLPPHLMVPPPLPQNIPEPPPPPRPPPAEPQPPPLPPHEGQLVGPLPFSEDSMLAAGNATAMMAGVPGLDLDGSDPLQVPNTPPPMPPPLLPPPLPKIMHPMEPPAPLSPVLMNPGFIARQADASLGVDMAHMLPDAKTPALGVVTMPVMPDLSLLNTNTWRA